MHDGALAREPLRLHLLGGWRLDGLADSAHVPPAVRRLLACLALQGPSARHELAATIWPDASEPHAQGSLRTALWRARALHPLLVTCVGETAGLGAQVAVDVRELAHDVRDLQSGRTSDWLRALPDEVRDGELLPGWYDDWLLLERERVRQLRLHALEGVAEVLAGEGSYALAVDAALAAVRADPLRESAHRALITVHLREGNPSEAVRQYRRCCELLVRELGVGPSPRLDELVGALARAVERSHLHAPPTTSGGPATPVPSQVRSDCPAVAEPRRR